MVGQTTPDGVDVWQFTDQGRALLLAISDEASYVLRLPAEQVAQLAHELLVEGIPAEVRLADATKVPHKKVVCVVGDEKRLSLVLAYQSLGAAVMSHGVARDEMALPDLDVFNEIVESFRRHFGTKAKFKRKEHTPARATLGPGVLAACIALFTGALASGFLTKDEHSSGSLKTQAGKAIFSALLDAIDPIGVTALGVVGVIGCIWWGYTCYKNPPIRVTVKP